MKRYSIATLRRAVIVLFIMTVILVAWTLRKRPGESGETPAPGAAPSAGPRQTSSKADVGEGIDIISLQGDRIPWKLSAKHHSIAEDGAQSVEGDVTFTLEYTVQGQHDTATIQSDSGSFIPSGPKGRFKGNVRVKTGQGLALTTDSLVYQGGDAGLAKTDAPVQFTRKAISGSCRGLVYHVTDNKVEMLADVQMTIQDEVRGDTLIRSGRALLDKTEGNIKFIDQVMMEQGINRLTADRVVVFFDAEERAIQRIKAIDKAVLVMSGAGVAGLRLSAERTGTRVLRSRLIDIVFRPDRSLQELTAGPEGGELIIEPSRLPQSKRRRIVADLLVMSFDPLGRLEKVYGRRDVEVTGVDRSQDTRVMTKASLSERLRCQTMTVDLDGGSGDIKRGEFHKDVRFERGRSRASARKALFESSFLMLREGPPELIDEAIGTRLTADSINLGMEERQGEVSARGQVRHVLRGGGQQQSGLLGGDELLASGRFFNYDSKTRVTQYRDNAILRSAKSEIRGESITITDGSAGRQLSASGAVVTLMTGNAKDSAVDARADAMQYSEQHRELIYRGNADLHQGALRVKTPQSIIVTLAEEGGLQRMIAGDTQVEAATDGGRRASGRQLTYTPVDGKLSIVGRPAQFTDLSRTVEGLSLTFYLGDDRIAIDGQDVQRTITRIPREIPQP